MRPLLLALALLLALPAQAQDSDPYLRHAAVSPNGQQIAFSYQGDLWVAPIDGQQARRLTVHEAYDGMPRWSAEGEQIAFVSDRFGNDDLFVMDVAGSRPRRLTYHDATDRLTDVTADGRALFTTKRTWAQVEWDNEMHAVSLEGGTPVRMLDAFGHAPTLSPDGRFVVYEHGANGRDRKRYRGPANRDLWLYDTESGDYRQLTAFEGNDFGAQWVGPKTLLFISERSGTYNIHRLELDSDGNPSGEPVPVTDEREQAVRFFSASADGGTIAFSRFGDLYVMQEGGEPVRFDVQLPADYRFDPVEVETLTKGAESYAVSPDGEHVAFVVRGELFLRSTDPEESRTVQVTHHPYRDRDVTWANDSTLLFVSDREGQYDLYQVQPDDEEAETLLETLDWSVARLTETEENERNPLLAPDSVQVAFQRGRGGLVTARLEEGTLEDETVQLDGWDAPSGVRWSPDSRYLAYSLSDLNFNEEVYIHPVDGSREPVNVSQHPRSDGQPVWSPDGSKLGFVSERSSGSDVWFVWLREADWEKTQADWKLEEQADDDEENGEEEGDGEEDEELQIDFERIYERLERVSALPGNESSLAISEDGETFFFVANRRSWSDSYKADPDLYSIKWDGSEQKRLTEGGVGPYGLSLADDHLYYLRSGGLIGRISPTGSDRASLGFAAEMRIDHEAERRQIFAEAWRALDRGFYDPAYHGQDWEELRDRYRPWALRASTTRDFGSVMNMMLGELNASHMGYYAGDRAETQERSTGLLGVEIEVADEGVRIVRVVPDSPADREESKLQAGEMIVAVGGRPVAEAPNFWSLLEGAEGDRVRLRVRDAEGEERTVRIRPTGSLGDELYDEWVADRRRLVDEYSDGRLGYIHVEGMNWPSFERFERELTSAGAGKEGLLIDVRYNGGGWTTDYLLTVLNVRRHAYTIPRGAADDLAEQQEDFRGYYPFGERLPFAAWTKPVAALSNANSYSNAEIFSHAFKTLDLGPLVGEPTFGAVISTGGRGLIDGSFVRLPFRGWYVYADDRNMENGPARPDILVDNPADARGEGVDRQLQVAAQRLLQQIDAAK